MPKYILLTRVVLIATGVFAGYFATEYLVSTNSDRYPASLNLKKDQNLARPIGKLNIDHVSYDYFQIKIENINLSADRNGLSEVKVEIKALKDFNSNLQYQWILDDEVNSSDLLQGEIKNLKSGETQEIVLQVKNYSKDYKSFVSFKVVGTINSQRVYRDVIISSRPEDSFEYLVQESFQKSFKVNDENKARNKNSASAKTKKISSKLQLGEKFNPENITR